MVVNAILSVSNVVRKIKYILRAYVCFNNSFKFSRDSEHWCAADKMFEARLMQCSADRITLTVPWLSTIRPLLFRKVSRW